MQQANTVLFSDKLNKSKEKGQELFS